MATSEEIKIELGNQISILRKLKGWTQQELAEVTDLSYNFIGQIERAEKMPGPETLIKISTALGIKIDVLFERCLKHPKAILMIKEIEQRTQDLIERKDK